MSISKLEGHPQVFVIGDSTAAVNAQEAPRVAPVAMEQGRVAALNIGHLRRGEPLETYEYASKGMLVSLGMNYAVVKIGRIQVSGYFAWLFWNAVHLYKLVGLKKQLQVAGDWMLGPDFSARLGHCARTAPVRLCGK